MIEKENVRVRAKIISPSSEALYTAMRHAELLRVLTNLILAHFDV
jgi:hypothetical protein